MSRKTVGLEPEEYRRLREIKEEAERRAGVHFDWGSFLLGAITGGLIASIVRDIVREQRQEREERGGKKESNQGGDVNA